ncbi:MAG TPA: recombinase family protein [Epulopiscium sp.]|nr:recombinase family protein [Candidatus Epulonipiscium sp.]
MVRTKKNVAVIPPQLIYDRDIRVELKLLRVAAYCRVSTALEEQEGSYQAQVSYYTDKIKDTPNWTSAGIYADDGISATNTKKRDDFNAMIGDCMAGKIDMVITKSVSRFARNTVDSLQAIRKLKEKNIAVFFEKEGINTLESNGELLITILSSQAQEESRNISENTKWGITRRFENGIISVNHKRFMGYTKNEHEELVIVPEQAKIVKRIFRMYLEGSSILEITRALEEDKIKTVTGKDQWQPGTIAKMLVNEKYMGDALMQKTYTVDFLTKERANNNGVIPQYYIEDNHEGIIPKEIFYKVQEEKARRASLHKPSVARKENKLKKEKSKYSSKYALTEILVCVECGHPYRRQVWSKYGQKSAVWRCENRLKNGTKATCKNSPTLKEEPLHETIMVAINNVVEDSGDFIGAFRENVIRVIGGYSKKYIPAEYDEKIESLQKDILTLIEENAKQGVLAEDFDDGYKRISEQINELKKTKTRLIQEKKQVDRYEERLIETNSTLKTVRLQVREFDEDLVRRLIQSIKVNKGERLEIQFKAGIVTQQIVDYHD